MQARSTDPRPIARRAARAIAAVLVLAAGQANGQDLTSQRLTLGGAARLAAERSASAVTARDRAYQAGARTIQARAELLPSLSAGTTVNGGDNEFVPLVGGTSPSGVSLTQARTVTTKIELTQRVFDLGTFRRWQAAAADAATVGADARTSAQRAAEQGAMAHLRVLRAQAQLEARVADSSLAAELESIAEQQVRAGTAIALDVTRADSHLASTISALIAARNERAVAELELVRVLLLPLATRLEVGDSLRPPVPGDLTVTESEATTAALLRRGEVMAAASAGNAARRQVAAVKAERLPAISAFASTGSGYVGFMDRQNYGVRVSVPVFDGFHREAQIAEGQAREREAATELFDARLRVAVEIRSALLDLSAARQRVTAATAQLRLAEQEVAQARARFAAGVASNADLINASLSLNAARDQVVDALATYHGARVELAAAQGRATELP
jgi:outer membrane protein